MGWGRGEEASGWLGNGAEGRGTPSLLYGRPLGGAWGIPVRVLVYQVRLAISVSILMHEVDRAVLIHVLVYQIGRAVAVHVLVDQIHPPCKQPAVGRTGAGSD